jgi:hypothetical protein
MHLQTKCKLQKLEIRYLDQHSDTDNILSLVSENINELGEMSKGKFNNLPPWDNCHYHAAAYKLNDTICMLQDLAKLNGINLNDMPDQSSL